MKVEQNKNVSKHFSKFPEILNIQFDLSVESHTFSLLRRRQILLRLLDFERLLLLRRFPITDLVLLLRILASFLLLTLAFLLFPDLLFLLPPTVAVLHALHIGGVGHVEVFDPLGCALSGLVVRAVPVEKSEQLNYSSQKHDCHKIHNELLVKYFFSFFFLAKFFVKRHEKFEINVHVIGELIPPHRTDFSDFFPACSQ
jgi:hypothetical protein